MANRPRLDDPDGLEHTSSRSAECQGLVAGQDLPQPDFRKTAFLASEGTRISSPGDVADRFAPEDTYRVREFLSWADESRDLSAWLGNPMQRSAAKGLFDLEEGIRASGDRLILRDWRRLTASDHLYYMSTKGASDGVVHDYFSPHPTPHDTFASFMNILHDLKSRIDNS